MWSAIKRHPLAQTLVTLRGNPRACVFTEPLWGISFNLYTPFIALYMAALGLSNQQIGLLATINMGVQIVAAAVSGPLADKYGRRLMTFVADLTAWAVPCLVFALSQNFIWFVAATVLAGTGSIVNNAWQLLLVEDCDQELLVPVYTLITISGLLAVLFAPISTLLITSYSLVPVMRGLYVFASVMMAVKCSILYRFSTETVHGKLRMEETRHTSILRLTFQLKNTFEKMIRNPATFPVMAMFILFNISGVVSGNFFSLFATRSLHIPSQYMAFFPMIRSVVMFAFLVGLQHVFMRYHFHKPMLLGLSLYILATLALILPWAGGWARTVLYTLLEAFAFSIVSPRKDSLIVIFIEKQERARIMGLLYVFTMLVSAPFGWIAGVLAARNQGYPFLLNLCVFALFIALVTATRKLIRPDAHGREEA